MQTPSPNKKVVVINSQKRFTITIKHFFFILGGILSLHQQISYIDSDRLNTWKIIMPA
jgi:hypothetical protein